jgi:hypothetical protein
LCLSGKGNLIMTTARPIVLFILLIVAGCLLVLQLRPTGTLPATPTTPLEVLPAGSLPTPSKYWIAQQMEVAYRALNSSYTPPNKYTEITRAQTYYFPRHNVMLTGIPKAGCTNWKIAMLRAEGALTDYQEKMLAVYAENVHGPMCEKYRMSSYKRSWNTTYNERIKSVQSVLVLRNPWVRAVSAYRQKLSSEHRTGGVLWGMKRIIVEDMRGEGAWHSKEDAPTFKEFIQYSIKENGIGDRHFRPQWKYISHDLIRYDHVIPLELVGQMVGPLFAELEIDRKNLEGSYDHTSDPRNQSSVVKAREFLSSLSLELVEEFYKIYKIDFMLLNYSNFTDPNFPLPVGYY